MGRVYRVTYLSGAAPADHCAAINDAADVTVVRWVGESMVVVAGEAAVVQHLFSKILPGWEIAARGNARKA